MRLEGPYLIIPPTASIDDTTGATSLILGAPAGQHGTLQNARGVVCIGDCAGSAETLGSITVNQEISKGMGFFGQTVNSSGGAVNLSSTGGILAVPTGTTATAGISKGFLFALYPQLVVAANTFAFAQREGLWIERLSFQLKASTGTTMTNVLLNAYVVWDDDVPAGYSGGAFAA